MELPDSDALNSIESVSIFSDVEKRFNFVKIGLKKRENKSNQTLKKHKT